MTNILLLIFVGVILGVVFWLRTLEDKQVAESYEKVETLMNKSEFMLFQELQKQLSGKYLVFSKVRMEDFVHVKKGLERKRAYGLRSRIKSRHTDFLICDMHAKTLMAIELDGGSHNGSRSAKSDKFKDVVCEKIGLPLKRIRVGDNFEKKSLKFLNSYKTHILSFLRIRQLAEGI